MHQNKIFHNYFLEIFKTFLMIVFGLSMIAFTVRAVNFLELIVDNGYSLSTYFKYSILNVFGIAPKFFPIAFLISLVIFLVKHKENGEFIILWTAGIKKSFILNLLLFSSLTVMILYLIFSTYLTPLSLSKSRTLLSESKFNSILPTIRPQQFSDSFKGFTFFVEKKVDNEIEKIFLHDTGSNLNNFSSSISDTHSTTIIAQKGIVADKKLFLINGQIISYKKSKSENEIIKFDQLNIDLNRLNTSVIKNLKLQEESTYRLMNCFSGKKNNLSICKKETLKEITPNLFRRLVLPAYIPAIALICSFLLLVKQNLLVSKVSIFIYNFILLILTELILKYTGTNIYLKYLYLIFPLIIFITAYPYLIYRFSK